MHIFVSYSMIEQNWGTCTCMLLTTKITLMQVLHCWSFSVTALKYNHGLNVLHEVSLISLLHINSSLWWRAFISSGPTPSPKAIIAKILQLVIYTLRILYLATRNDFIFVIFTFKYLIAMPIYASSTLNGFLMYT